MTASADSNRAAETRTGAQPEPPAIQRAAPRAETTRRAAISQDLRSPRERIERKLWRAWKLVRHRAAAPRAALTVFVAGMQRSGTNMLMEALEWSARTDVYHETDPRAFANYEMRPRAVIRDLIDRSRAPAFVIKSLCELDQIGSLMDAFEPAKAVWIIRNFDDTVNSATRSFGHFAHQVHRLAKNKSAAGWRGRGMSDQTQAQLRRLDHPALTDGSAAALMWYYRNVLLFEQGLERDPRIMVVRYESLVRDPRAELLAVFRFLGLPDWSPWVSRYIHPKSIGKSPRADIEPGVRDLCEGLQARFDAVAAASLPHAAGPAVDP